MNSHMQREDRGESFALGLVMKSTADTTNMLYTRCMSNPIEIPNIGMLLM